MRSHFSRRGYCDATVLGISCAVSNSQLQLAVILTAVLRISERPRLDSCVASREARYCACKCRRAFQGGKCRSVGAWDSLDCTLPISARPFARFLGVSPLTKAEGNCFQQQRAQVANGGDICKGMSQSSSACRSQRRHLGAILFRETAVVRATTYRDTRKSASGEGASGFH